MKKKPNKHPAVPMPPCDKCSMAPRCRVEKISCLAFDLYVNTGRKLRRSTGALYQPSKGWYALTYARNS